MRLAKVFHHQQLLENKQMYQQMLEMPWEKLPEAYPEHDEAFIEALIPSIKETLQGFLDSITRVPVLNKMDRIVYLLKLRKLLMLRTTFKMKTNEIEKLRWVQKMISTDNGWVDYIDDIHPHSNSILIMSPEEMAHFLSLPFPPLQNFNIGNQNPYSLHMAFRDLETEFDLSFKGDKGVRQQSQDEIILEFPDGYAWVNLHRSSCKQEGAALGHCGNSPRSNTDDTVLSLRKLVRPGVWKPSVTFILESDGFLGERKGAQNKSPHQKYHPYIVELLKQPFIKGIKNGHWMNDQDFYPVQLSDTLMKDLLKSRPDMFTVADFVVFGTNLDSVMERLHETNGKFLEQLEKSVSLATEFYRNYGPPEALEKVIKNLVKFLKMIQDGDFNDQVKGYLSGGILDIMPPEAIKLAEPLANQQWFIDVCRNTAFHKSGLSLAPFFKNDGEYEPLANADIRVVELFDDILQPLMGSLRQYVDLLQLKEKIWSYVFNILIHNKVKFSSNFFQQLRRQTLTKIQEKIMKDAILSSENEYDRGYRVTDMDLIPYVEDLKLLFPLYRDNKISCSIGIIYAKRHLSPEDLETFYKYWVIDARDMNYLVRDQLAADPKKLEDLIYYKHIDSSDIDTMLSELLPKGSKYYKLLSKIMGNDNDGSIVNSSPNDVIEANVPPRFFKKYIEAVANFNGWDYDPRENRIELATPKIESDWETHYYWPELSDKLTNSRAVEDLSASDTESLDEHFEEDSTLFMNILKANPDLIEQLTAVDDTDNLNLFDDLPKDIGFLHNPQHFAKFINSHKDIKHQMIQLLHKVRLEECEERYRNMLAYAIVSYYEEYDYDLNYQVEMDDGKPLDYAKVLQHIDDGLRIDLTIWISSEDFIDHLGEYPVKDMRSNIHMDFNPGELLYLEDDDYDYDENQRVIERFVKEFGEILKASAPQR